MTSFIIGDIVVTVEIEYCSPCKYLPLALRHAEQLLNEFGQDISVLKLVPGDHGVYDIRVGGKLIYSTVKVMKFHDYEVIQRAVKRALKSRA